MKRILIIFIIVFATLPCRSQWQNTKFPVKVLAFGVHDTSFFLSNVPLDGGIDSYLDSLVFRYQDGDWIALGTGIDRTQGNITSFASLGKYFFAGQTEPNGAAGPAYTSTNNGSEWTNAALTGEPIYTNGTYLFGTYGFFASGKIQPDLVRSIDSGKIWDSIVNLSVSAFGGKGSYVFASTSKGLYRSMDSGGTWNPVTTPISGITCFAVVGTVIYAANGTQLMVSIDSGAMWQLMSTNFSVSVLATNGVRLFAGGDSGVCMLNKDGSTWTNESDTGTLRGHGVVALGVFDTLLFADFVNVNYPYDLYDRSIPEMVDTAKELVQTLTSDDTLSIYPNPASGVVTIISGGTSIYGVSVLNVLGEDVIDMPNLRESDITLDLSKIPSGTYFLRIETDNGSVLRKVVVQH